MSACKACGSDNLSWDTTNRITSSVVQGRLTTRDVECVFVLGCNICSETLRVVGADDVAAMLPLTWPLAAISRATGETGA